MNIMKIILPVAMSVAMASAVGAHGADHAQLGPGEHVTPNFAHVIPNI